MLGKSGAVMILMHLNIHKDPFDRLLIAQAKIENATIVSADTIFSQYPVTVGW